MPIVGKLEEYLDKAKISYEVYHHRPAFTAQHTPSSRGAPLCRTGQPEAVSEQATGKGKGEERFNAAPGSVRFYMNILLTYFPDRDPLYDLYYQQILEQVELAEELGWECFMFNEHHLLGYGGLYRTPP